MKYFWNCSRDLLAESLALKAAPSSITRTDEDISALKLSSSELCVIWSVDPSIEYSLPDCIIVRNGQTNDFLAWISTYFRNLRPFTAHCRVLEQSSVGLSRECPFNYRNLDTAMAISESVMLFLGKFDIRRIGYSTCTRTLSFSLAQYYRRNDSSDRPKDLEDLLNKWTNARILIGQDESQLSPKETFEIWRLVTDSLDNRKFQSKCDKAISSIISRAYSGESLDYTHFVSLFAKQSVLASLLPLLDGPREERVNAVREMLAILSKDKKTTLRNKSIIAGYFVSRIQPGTLEHFQILTPSLPELKEAVLWYSAFAGIAPRNNVNDFLGGMGWFLKREFQRSHSWIDRPKSDISFEELNLISGTFGSNKIPFLTKASAILDVELSPFVSTMIRVVESQLASPSHSDVQGELFAAPQKDSSPVEKIRSINSIRRRLDEILHQLDRIERL